MSYNKRSFPPVFLKIAKVGVPVLRRKAKTVTNIRQRQFQDLIRNMMTTLKDVEGLGLAAPQVYQSWRIFIFSSFPSPFYPQAQNIKPTVVVNPKIISRSHLRISGWEGCLSLPGIRGKISRSEKIEVEYLNQNGKKIYQLLNGLAARVFQHEYDHLEGIIFTDRLESMKDIISEEEYQKLAKKPVLIKNTVTTIRNRHIADIKKS